MAEQVRVGVLGASLYTDPAHLRRIQSHPGAQLVAICGRSRSRAEDMARRYGIPQVYTDYREMLESGRLHALVVSVPDDQHYAVTMDALDVGLHILCEKPLALTLEQARAMYARAEAAHVKHMVCFTNRWVPHCLYLKQLLDEGYIGRCFHCQLGSLGGYGLAARYAWRFDRRHALGILGDLGSHMIDLARWLVGDIVRVSAHLGTYVDRSGPQGESLDPASDAALLMVEFANGAQGIIQASAVAHTGDRLQEQHIRLHGQSGTLEADAYHFLGVQVRGIRGSQERFHELTVPEELWGNVNREQPLIAQVMEAFTQQPIGDRLFIDAILRDLPVSPSFYDGLKAQEVMAAAITSHEQGVWVAV